jgi:hypothetical protein
MSTNNRMYIVPNAIHSFETHKAPSNPDFIANVSQTTKGSQPEPWGRIVAAL